MHIHLELSRHMDEKNADEIFKAIQSQVSDKEGKFVAIDIESEDYFLGNTLLEAYDSAHQKYLEREFFYKRIGRKAAFVVGS
jgi:hypothetical protein